MSLSGESDDIARAKELAAQATALEERERLLKEMRDHAAAGHANARVQELNEDIARLRGEMGRLRERIKRIFD